MTAAAAMSRSRGWHGEAFDASLEAVLHSPRLRLEPQLAAHAERLYPLLLDPRLYAHIPAEPPASLDALRERLQRLSSRRSPHGDELWLNWVLCDARDGALVGRVQTTVRTDLPAYMAYEVFPSHWQQGYATEGCTCVMQWLVDELQVSGFMAEVDSLNTASLRLLERLGFQRTQFRAAADRFKGRASDEWTLHLSAAGFERAHAR